MNISIPVEQYLFMYGLAFDKFFFFLIIELITDFCKTQNINNFMF